MKLTCILLLLPRHDYFRMVIAHKAQAKCCCCRSPMTLDVPCWHAALSWLSLWSCWRSPSEYLSTLRCSHVQVSCDFTTVGGCASPSIVSSSRPARMYPWWLYARLTQHNLLTHSCCVWKQIFVSYRKQVFLFFWKQILMKINIYYIGSKLCFLRKRCL
jgi:hypothetical protein